MPADLAAGSHVETRRDLRIGQAAALAGVSTRTLRYYEELGLLQPSSRSTGGGRRYCEEDLARLLRIRELQSLMGFNLRDIQAVMAAEDRLQVLRLEFHSETPMERRLEIVAEGIAVVEELRGQVAEKLQHVERFLASLEEKGARYRAYQESISKQ